MEKEFCRVKTGMNALDREIGGLGKGELIVLGGRPGMGKTAFGCSLINNVCIDENKTSVFYSLGESKDKIEKRLVKMRNFEYEIQHPERKNTAEKDVFEAPLLIYDRSDFGITDITDKCREIQKEQKIDLVVVDCLQIVKCERKPLIDIDDQDKFIKDLKLLSEKLDCPVFLLSHVYRTGERRVNHIPKPKDLGARKAVNKYADMVMFIIRPYYYNLKEDKSKAKVYYIKGKQKGKVDISCSYDYVVFWDKSADKSAD